VAVTRDEFAAAVEAARARHPVWFDLLSDERADSGRLQEVEAELECVLPGGFTWFLQEYGGRDFALASIYSADRGSDLYLTLNQPQGLRRGLVAVSDDDRRPLRFPDRGVGCVDEIAILDHEAGEVRPTDFGGALEFIVRQALQPA
jgi:hypothetical protein